MRVIIAAGGTAGHVNPALAIADEILCREPGSDILFVGRNDGMERELVAAAGYAFYHIETHGFERKFTPKALLFNLYVLWHVLLAGGKARRLFKKIKPDIVIGCGGYSSGPIVRKAAKMGIKTAVQEQNAYPGVTTRLLSKMVDIVFLPGEDAVGRLEHPERCVVAGNPVREAFFHLDRIGVRAKWRVGARICVVSFGGSLGAGTLNRIAVKFMKLHSGTGRVYHIHATGQYGTESVPRMLHESGVEYENCPDIKIVEYIDNMPDCFAAADLILSRAGAITISELAAAGRASVLIPSPNVAENHQYYNALTLQNVQAAQVYEEKDLDEDAVAAQLWQLCQSKKQLREMGENAAKTAIPDSAGIIYRHIAALVYGAQTNTEETD